MEKLLWVEIAILKVHKADKFENLVYRRSPRNYNPIMPATAEFIIAEVEEFVETGEVDPDG